MFCASLCNRCKGNTQLPVSVGDHYVDVNGSDTCIHLWLWLQHSELKLTVAEFSQCTGQ